MNSQRVYNVFALMLIELQLGLELLGLELIQARFAM